MPSNSKYFHGIPESQPEGNLEENKKLLLSFLCSMVQEASYIFFSLNPPNQPLRLALLCPSAGEQTEDQKQVAQSLVQSGDWVKEWTQGCTASKRQGWDLNWELMILRSALLSPLTYRGGR